MEETRLAWLAGLIDGEGCLSVRHVMKQPHKAHRNSLELRLEITSVSTKMIDTTCQILAEMDISVYRDKPRFRPKSTRPAIKIRIQQKYHLHILLRALLPYLVVKKPEAERCLQFLDLTCAKPNSHYRLQESDLSIVGKLKALKRIA